MDARNASQNDIAIRPTVFLAQRNLLDSRNDFLVRPFVFPHALSLDECSKAISQGMLLPFRKGRLVEDIPDYRVCQLAEMNEERENLWLFDRIRDIFSAVNLAWYKFETTQLIEPLQLTRYDTGGRIGWHSDCGPAETSTRKLSLTIQLSNSTDYSGGLLEFLPGGEMAHAKEIGTAVIFPSYLTHQISPVQSGQRMSLVSWLHGPAFR